ncbi:MAG: acyltransferase family protein [Anaerolineae bacterium]|nr:acyltransferase family protein [Anaerolineae bacterium]
MSANRLHYLDWLRVMAILGVFLYHAIHPFDLTDWHIKNTELSLPLTALLLFFAPWGMPLFFLVAGTGTWFALRHRTVRQYVAERCQRLLIPFICGCLLLTPVMLYTEWTHKVQTGVWHTSFQEFLGSRGIPIGPQIFGWMGYHLWFLGFLFSFSLLALPIFVWLRRESGQRWLSRIVGLTEHRGGILLIAMPLLVIQLAFRIFFYEGEHNWADFFFLLAFFVLGYILYTDERWARAIPRDWRIILGTAMVTTAILLVLMASSDAYDWVAMPWLPGFYLAWTLIVINGWCWTLLVVYIGMRFLDFSNQWLQYGQEAVLPFFLFHQPVIMIIAFFVVQWDVAIPPKLLAVVVGSFVATVGLYDVIIRRIDLLRVIFGMKSRRHLPVPAALTIHR